ncbi:unnamed protein product [Paramecium octaurelia]|uniref:Uncharacterized protein n=1 Tax=Paramecium octaurelia TaxID=43137 RepID=A0A8S1YIY4_PAROT|nr:unnamed protein product [Paramecium octaurelia]
MWMEFKNALSFYIEYRQAPFFKQTKGVRAQTTQKKINQKSILGICFVHCYDIWDLKRKKIPSTLFKNYPI